jgi:hypothetical protein
MELLVEHPQVATRDCACCLKHLYKEDTGELCRRAGQPIPRTFINPAPCRTSKGCPKGTPENPKTLTVQNIEAYLHYRECCATGHFPDDGMVEYHAGLLAGIEKRKEQADQAELHLLLSLIGRR